MSDSAGAVAALLLEKLKRRKLTMCAAESCTGGLISKYMTDLSGSSSVFWGGFVTYSNEAKSELLSVKSALIESCGAVSKEVAEAMALGAVKSSGCHFSVAVTGIAGPGGGSSEKPVGTVWIGVCDVSQKVQTKKFLFSGCRSEVREKTAVEALKMLYDFILSNSLLTADK